MSRVGRVSCIPAYAACSCTITPPINVHWVCGTASTISTSWGHGDAHPPGGAVIRQTGRPSLYTEAIKQSVPETADNT
ncbi:Uncharacterised protein [Mycobacteroides abscessus subsp. abscessus]|nr:Uncharacterised protein [Mycobacteroides abscessus subsp. abscessus]